MLPRTPQKGCEIRDSVPHPARGLVPLTPWHMQPWSESKLFRRGKYLPRGEKIFLRVPRSVPQILVGRSADMGIGGIIAHISSEAVPGALGAKPPT